jgi:hypothetical protein
VAPVITNEIRLPMTATVTIDLDGRGERIRTSSVHERSNQRGSLKN